MSEKWKFPGIPKPPSDNREFRAGIPTFPDLGNSHLGNSASLAARSSGFAVLILYRSGGSLRIYTDLHGSVLGQYGSVLGQYGSVLGQNGSVRIYTDLYGSIRICTGLYKICTGSVQILTREGEIACIPYKITTKSLQSSGRSVQLEQISTRPVHVLILAGSVQISTGPPRGEQNQMHSVQKSVYRSGDISYRSCTDPY